MPDLFFGGGLNEADPFNASPDECIEGANFVLNALRRNFRPRDAQDLMGTATNGEAIRGIMQMIARDSTVTTLVKAGPVVYSWDGSTFTSEKTDVTTSSRLRSTHWSLDDILVITDTMKATPMWKWDGTDFERLRTNLVEGSPVAVGITRAGSTATVTHTSHGFASDDLVKIAGATETEYNGEYQITVTGANTYTYTVSGAPSTPATGSPTADAGVDLSAKYAVIKDNRVWLFNLTVDGTEVPHGILASKFEDPQNYDNANRGLAQDPSSTVTGSDPFLLLSPDLRPINGVQLFQQQVIMSTLDGRLYRLVGSDPSDYNWVDYYTGSAATGTETMVNAGNDVYFVKQGGDIDRLSDTERSGDVSADDMSIYIPITKERLTDPIAVYDQANQRVVWFEPNGFVLVFDKDVSRLSQVSPWMKWTTLMPNGFVTEAATFLTRPGGFGKTVYWGDSSGRIYDLNGQGLNGDSSTYNVEATRKHRYFDELGTNIELLSGRVQYRRVGQCTLEAQFDWGEAYNTTNCAIPLKGPIISGTPKFFGGSDVFFNEDDYFAEGTIIGDDVADNEVSTAGFSAAGKSPGFFVTWTVSTAAKFLVDKVVV